MKVYKFYLTIIACLIVYLGFTAYNFSGFSISPVHNSEIIKFNHTKHVKDNGVECKVCHDAANSDKAADVLLPVMKTCAGCHDVEDKKECKLCHYDGVFKKLVSHKKELIFSHKAHIKMGKQCADCHGNMAEYKYAKDNPKSRTSMEICATCHNSEKATNNCEACHTNLTNLKPKNHLSNSFLNEHKYVFSTTDEKNNCMMCHSDNFCQVCHQPANYKGMNDKANFFAPFYTYNSGTRRDKAELQKLNNVHNLNYLYTHGLDAQHKGFECKTCHDPVQFCTSCHTNDGNLVSGIAPKTHLDPNFKTFGVGTGGGLHASLARNDIESCHDVDGADPVCIKCHFDNDGVKGTNPKTHETGFMKDNHGLWHNSQGAICYRCHTDPNARPTGRPGFGFCGYCHGKKGN